MICPNVNRNLIPIKILYFLFYGGNASFLPYKIVYQKQLGMSTAQSGIIEAIFQIASIISAPIFGVVADKTKAYKILLCVSLFFAASFTIPFYFVPKVDDGSSTDENTLCCVDGNLSIGQACQKNYSFPNISIDAESSDTNVVFDNGLYQQCLALRKNVTSHNSEQEIYGKTFAFLFCLTALLSLCYAPMIPLLDSSALESVGPGNAKDFGLQRLWGSVGFGIVGLCVGYLTDTISPPEIYGRYAKNYLVAICGTAVLWGCAIVVTATSVNVSAPKASGIFRGLKKLIAKINVIFFLVILIVSGFAIGMHFTFVFLFLQRFDDFQQLILGLAVLEGSLSEIPMFWISGWICRKFGCVFALSIGLCAYAVRFIAYTFISGAWQILAFEWLHGVAFALPMAALCSYASSVAPSGAVATLVSISSATYWQIGYTLGAFLGGLIYQTFGAIALFRGSSVLCFASAAIYWLCFGRFGIVLKEELRQEKKEEPGFQNQASMMTIV